MGMADPTYENYNVAHDDHHSHYQLVHQDQAVQDCGAYHVDDHQQLQEQCDVNALAGAVDAGLSLCTQAQMVAPADPAVGAVGPVSPMMWPLMNDVECPPSIWDYGDPLAYDYKGLD